jgi:hypothetical protein
VRDEAGERAVSGFGGEKTTVPHDLAAVLAPYGDAAGIDPDKRDFGVLARPTDETLEGVSEGRRVIGKWLVLIEDEPDPDTGKRLLNRSHPCFGPLSFGVGEKPIGIPVTAAKKPSKS